MALPVVHYPVEGPLAAPQDAGSSSARAASASCYIGFGAVPAEGDVYVPGLEINGLFSYIESSLSVLG